MKDKILKIIIILLILIIICIIGLIMIINNKAKEPAQQNNKSLIPEDTNTTVYANQLTTISNYFEDITDINTYYTIKDIVEEYFETLSKLNMTFLDAELEFASSSSITEDGIQNYMVKEIEFNAKKIEYYFNSTLKEKYNINYNNIDNLKEQLGNYHHVYVSIEDMYKMNKSDKIIFYCVKGLLIDKDTLEQSQLNMVVVTDTSNKTFEIYTENYLNDLGFKNLVKGKSIDLDVKSIENKKYNVYKDVNYETEQYVKEIFDTYKKNIQYNKNNSYNLLNDKYKSLRFENEEEYNKFIENENLRIINAKLSKYKTTKIEEYTQIVCLDEDNNYYIFNVTKPGTYTVYLDNYTILAEDRAEEYESAFINGKCSINLERFFDAVKDENYTYLYSLLSDSFKTSKFPTKNSFIEYVQNNFFKENEIESINTNMLSDGVSYLCDTIIVDKTENSKDKKNIKFTMKLKEDNNFELSFNIN